jgi:hypothetical protein
VDKQGTLWIINVDQTGVFRMDDPYKRIMNEVRSPCYLDHACQFVPQKLVTDPEGNIWVIDMYGKI